MSSSRVTRASQMISASFLSDAATMPLHWIYNQTDLSSKVGNSSPLFFHQLSCPFYTYSSGMLSCWGDESRPILTTFLESELADCNSQDLSDQYLKFFSTYTKGEENGLGYNGRINHVPKTFLETKASVDDFQAHGIIKVPFLVARYGGSNKLTEKVIEITKVLQSNEFSIICSLTLSKVLENILFSDLVNSSISQIIDNTILALDQDSEDKRGANLLNFVSNDENISSWLKVTNVIKALPVPEDDTYQRMRVQNILLTKVLSLNSLSEALNSSFPPKDQIFVDNVKTILAEVSTNESANVPSSIDVISSFGLSCALPGALLGPLYLALKIDTLEEALVINALAGGDNCSRSLVLGALFGAAYGGDSTRSVHEDWYSKINSNLLTDTNTVIDNIVRNNLNL